MWKEKFKNKMITLKPFNAEDLDQAIELFMDEKVKKTYMLPDFETREKAIALFERLKNLSYNEERFVRGIYLNGEFIGMVNDVGIEGDKLEIGYAIRSQYHNQGYGTEMLKIALNYLIEQGFCEVQAGAFEENPASTRIMEKAGMTRIDYTDEIEYRGKIHKCIYYIYKK